MARDIHIDTVDHVERSIIAIEKVYSDGHQIDPHCHRRGQLMTTASGLLVLTTPTGSFVMPPQRGMWIPPGVEHRVRMVGEVSMQSLYITPEAAPAMPSHCQVVGIAPFMRSLMVEAIELPLEYEQDSRAGALMVLIHREMEQLPSLPLSLPYPADETLAARCRQFIQRPNVHETINVWSHELAMSRRSFTRFFRRETGMSFVSWRQQACLLAALPRLASGESVTVVAMDLGYENPFAFTIMFKRAFGSSPFKYLSMRG